MNVSPAMNTPERLFAALTGKPVDRTPVSLYEIDGFGARYSPDHPSYARVRSYARERADNMVLETPAIPGPLGFLYTGGNEDDVFSEVRHEGPDEITTTTIFTPRGPLRMVKRLNADTYTIWTTEFLLKNEKDVDRLLSLPYVRAAPSMEKFDALKQKMCDRGIMLPDLIDPVVMISSVMPFEQYILLSVLNRKKYRALLDFFAERLHDYLDAVLERGAGPLFRIVGPELCTPPYMHPEDFREFIVAYDKPFIEKIHRAGCYARIHCHGKISKVVDLILEMEPDALDPVEEPPGGDILFSDAKRLLGGSVCLMGNIQESVFELKKPEEVTAEVRRIKEIGAPDGRFVLMPTATPITVPLSSRVEENLLAYLETGLE
ncbi:MAG: uroporphyrinogen decarboxylase family protein [Candidatus Latescibacter sp.]|nr:uroporphyrinogen decarboxylase family protein [Candidatus Latescibacter sp.]